MSIKIYTEFHPSTSTAINAGEIQLVKTTNATPRNLMTAYAFLCSHRSAMNASWGNVGHVRSWISINGHDIDDEDCNLWLLDADTPKDILDDLTRTDIASKIITENT